MEKSGKKKLLLHVCCAVCASGSLERLGDEYDVTAFFCNPNIDIFAEYQKRLSELERYVRERGLSVKIVDAGYEHERFLAAAEGLELYAEGGKRCEKCIYMRLRATAEFARDNGFDLFTTTLSISPHKDYDLIERDLTELSKEYGVDPLLVNFKKKDGFLIAGKLAKQYNIYRQNYCGCEFAKYGSE